MAEGKRRIVIFTCDTPGNLDLHLSIIRCLIGVDTENLSLLDLCCGEMSSTRHLPFRHSIHVDVLDISSRPENAIFSQDDAIDFISKSSDTFDVVLCLDGIEHLTKKRGLNLLEEMHRISERIAIIFTPDCEMGLYPESVDPDVHKSQWYPSELNALGWNVAHFRRWHDSWKMGAIFAWKLKP